MQGEMRPFEVSAGKERFLIFLLALLIGVLTLNAMYDEPGQYSSLRFAVTGFCAFIILFLNGFSLGPISGKAGGIVSVWMLFSLLSLLSALVNRDDLLGEVWQLCGVPLVFFLAFPYLTGRHGRAILAWGLTLGFAAYVLVSMVKYPLSTSYYKGVFFNANTLGLVLAGISAGLFTALRGLLGKRQLSALEHLGAGCLGLGNLVVAMLIVFTGSRTSFIAFMAMALLFYWTLYLDREHLRTWLWGMGGLFVLLATGFSLVLLLGDGQNVFANLTGKFSSNPDMTVLSGREYIWRQVFKEAAFLGHGNLYFTAQIGRLAHNAYLAVLGTKGVAAFFLLLSFHGMVWFLAFWQTLVEIRRDGYAGGPLFIVTAYILIGLTESVGGILGNGLHVAFLLAVGLIIANKEGRGLL